MPEYAVLIPVALPSSGPELLRIARLFAPPKDLRVTALHCVDEQAPSDEDPLALLLEGAGDVRVDPVRFASTDVECDILAVARERMPELILMGWHRSMVPDGEQPGPVHGVLKHAQCDVAIFLARAHRPIGRVLVPFYGGKHDRRALQVAAHIAENSNVGVTVLHVISPNGDSPTAGLSNVVERFDEGRVQLKMVENDDPVEAAIHEAWTGYDLIVAGASDVWGVDFSLFSENLQKLAFATPASLLVVHAHQPPKPSLMSGRSATTDRVSVS